MSADSGRSDSGRSGSGRSDSSLAYRRNPLRMAVSGGLWRGAWYLLGYVFVVGWVLFAAAFTAVTTAAVLAVTVAGIPLLTATAAVLRGCANVERVRLRQVFTGPVRGQYRSVAGQGIVARARIRWRDGATWRDLAYLIGLWAPLFALDTAVLTVWLTFLAGITVPVWYWAPKSTGVIGYTNGTAQHGLALGYFPHGPHGPGAHGIFVDALPSALLVAAICLILFLLFNYVLVATARAHASVARALLRAPADPLAEAKDVLARPGPIPPLQNVSPAGIPDGATVITAGTDSAAGR
jgi:Putative sensor